MTDRIERQLEDAAEAHRGRLWGLSYRMTGSAAEADDIVQETFLRMFDKRPDSSRPLGPWLTRVTMNLARDRLRARQRRREEYVGEWLPEPAVEAGREPIGVDRLVVRETARFAFLVALETLTPTQRAVFLLRDVCELSTKETAAALGLTLSNVKTTLHRARKALGDVPEEPLPRNAVSVHRKAMSQLFVALMAGDLDRMCELLADDVKATQDAGGAYAAATRTVVGPRNVARLFLGIMGKHDTAAVRIEEVEVNGTLAWVVHHPASGRLASVSVMLVDTAPDGRITRVDTVVSPDKLDRLLARLGV